jgi:hypothetical protein
MPLSNNFRKTRVKRIKTNGIKKNKLDMDREKQERRIKIEDFKRNKMYSFKFESKFSRNVKVSFQPFKS